MNVLKIHSQILEVDKTISKCTLKLLLNFTFLSAELRCLSESRLDDKLLCSDGSVENKWDGCVDKGSVRVQCPKGFVPCNKLRDNGVEFKCGTDCSRNGGQRTCFGIQ